jgi:DNA-binding response OmpR family regulator
MSTKVLLVDDEELFVEVLAVRLRARGMAVATATSVKKAFQKMKDGDFDVVVLDLMMPEMDGLKGLTLLKMRDPDLPVIVFTADFA